MQRFIGRQHRRGIRPRVRARQALVAALVATAAAALVPSAALADGDLVATPARVKDSASISVRWTPRAAPDRDLFTYTLSVSSSNAKGCANGSSRAIAATWKAGETLRFTVRPSDGGRSWCTGGAGVLIRVASTPRTPGSGGATLATAFVSVADDPSTPPNAGAVFRVAGGGRLYVSPASDIGPNTTVTVSWRTTAKLARDEAYQVVFQAGKSPEAVAPTCIAGLPRVVGRGSARGKLIRVRMTPYVRQGLSGWCPAESAAIVIQRVKLDATGSIDQRRLDRVRDIGSAYGLRFRS